MRLSKFRLALCVGLMTTTVVTAAAAQPAQAASNNPAIDRLLAENAGARVSVNPATGAVRFVRLPAGSAATGATTAQARSDSAAAFVNRYGPAFGLRSGIAELELRRSNTDKVGQSHLSYTQVHAGLPVFGSFFKVHFDARGQISAANGTLVPGIDVAAAPVPQRCGRARRCRAVPRCREARIEAVRARQSAHDLPRRARQGRAG